MLPACTKVYALFRGFLHLSSFYLKFVNCKAGIFHVLLWKITIEMNYCF